MKNIIILSGGLDSTTLLYDLRKQGNEIKALSFNYGQRHKKELSHASLICEKIGVEHRIVDLSTIAPLFGDSSQTNPAVEVPEGHYAAENMKLTVVPNRNMIMLSIAAAWAMATKADSIAYAAHAGDHAIYPDCRPEFVSALEVALCLADWHMVRVDRPYVNYSKAWIAKRASTLGVPIELTWSCYKGENVHCGRCGTCVERILAFEEAGVVDATRYQEEKSYALSQKA